MTVTGKPIQAVTLVLMIAVLASCGDSAAPAGTSADVAGKAAPPASAPAGSPGYDILDVADFDYESFDYDQGDPEPGVILTASDRGELEALWTEIGSDRPVPSVDFGQQVVVAYLVGGSGSCADHLAEIDVDQDARTAQAVFAALLPQEVCTSDLKLRYYVAAIDLIDLGPGPMTINRIANRPREQVEPVVVDIPVHSGEAPALPPAPVDEVTNPEGVVPLPQLGEAINARLDDGIPVWAVGHDDGTITVVEAISPVGRDAVPGLPVGRVHSLARWLPGAQRFSTGHDAWGRSLLGPRADDLIRREAVVDGDRVLVGDQTSTIPGRPLTGVLPEGTSTEWSEPDIGEPVAMAEALANADTPAHVDEQLVIVTREGRSVARICPMADLKPYQRKPCPDEAPLVFDRPAPADSRGSVRVYSGPLFVEFQDGAISRVTLVSGGVSERVRR